MNLLNIKLYVLMFYICMCECLNNVKAININNITTTLQPKTKINDKCILSEYCIIRNEENLTSRSNLLNMEIEMEMEPENNKDDEDWSSWLKAQEATKANRNRRRRKKKRQRRKRKRRKQKGDKKKKGQHHHNYEQHTTLGQPANVLLATLQSLPEPLVKPQYNHHQQLQSIIKPHKYKKRITTTTPLPLKHINLLLQKSQIFKKKKKQYLGHLGAVFYPLVKFIAFFTVLNPFTLAVFFFMLISPIVFGILGFTAISLILKPVLNLIFAVKHKISRNHYNRKRLRQRQRQRPITIHKHYYQQHQQQQQQQQQKYKYKPIKHILQARYDLFNKPHINLLPPTTILPFNPILPHIKHNIKQQLPQQQQIFTNNYI